MLMLFLVLAITQGFVVENTENYPNYEIHRLPNPLSRSTTFANLRIHFELGAIQLDPVNQLLLTELMIPAAKSYLSAAFSTMSVTEPLVLVMPECAGMLIPDYFNFYGFTGTDVVVFLTGGESKVIEGSWASPCVRENGHLDQMVAGRIWLDES